MYHEIILSKGKILQTVTCVPYTFTTKYFRIYWKCRPTLDPCRYTLFFYIKILLCLARVPHYKNYYIVITHYITLQYSYYLHVIYKYRHSTIMRKSYIKMYMTKNRNTMQSFLLLINDVVWHCIPETPNRSKITIVCENITNMYAMNNIRIQNVIIFNYT